MNTDGEKRVPMGRIGAPNGVRGWVKVQSDTRPPENILTYAPWYLGDEERPRQVVEARRQGRNLVVRLEGIEDRDAAAALTHRVVSVARDQLPEPESDSYYWADLEGLTVVTPDGTELGTVHGLFETGANDVMVVRGERERLVPFLRDTVVHEVDVAAGRMTVDWDPDF